MAKNNGGSICAKGSNGTALNVVSNTPPKLDVFASTLVEGVHGSKGISGGEFAHNHHDPITKRVTKEIAGLPSNALATSGGNPGNIRSIHKLEVLRTRRQTSAIRSNHWDQYSGKFDVGYPVNAVDTLADDVAANPTRSVPGKLNFLAGGLVPSSVNYKSRTN